MKFVFINTLHMYLVLSKFALPILMNLLKPSPILYIPKIPHAKLHCFCHVMWVVSLFSRPYEKLSLIRMHLYRSFIANLIPSVDIPAVHTSFTILIFPSNVFNAEMQIFCQCSRRMR